MAEIAATSLPGLPESSGKFSKHKHATSSKKRHRDPSQTEKSERKHKKSRSDAVTSLVQTTETVDNNSAPKKKRKSHKSSKTKETYVNEERSQDEPVFVLNANANANANADADDDGDDGGVGETRSSEKKKKKKKEKSSKKDKKKSKKISKETHDQVADVDEDADDVPGAHGDPDAIVLASSRSKTFPHTTTSSQHRYPFYTQTVAQYLPLHPLGSNEPIQGYINQHLEPLLNRYVPTLGGVLLAYRNPRVGEAPGSNSLTEESATDDLAVFESINEYAVSYAWLTADIDLFQPSRGAWLEGLVNIQSEGHIGVVCWGKFNASIESGRLPQDWQWVDRQTSKEDEDEDTGAETASPDETEEGPAETSSAEVHTTGYWVDGEGAKIAADAPIRFRITNYEVGSSGDYGYLSIEGTMLPEGEEEKKVEKEMEILRRKARQGAPLRRNRRALLDSSITKFGQDDAKEPDHQPAETLISS